MRVTRFGAKALALQLLVLGAFYATPYSNLLFLLLAFLTLANLAGVVGAHRNLRGVEARVNEAEPVRSGTEVELAASLRAPGRARHQLEVRLELADGRALQGRAALLEGDARTTVRTTALPRGGHAVLRATVASSHPFGLVRTERAIPAPTELLVYPAPSEAVRARSAAEALDELAGALQPSAGALQPASLRDHREGEGAHDVHWRATARRGRLVVQEWEGGTGGGLELVLDRRCEWPVLEDALAVVSALVDLARAGKESLRLHTQGASVTYGEGGRPWCEALRWLALADALPMDAPAPPPASPSVARLPQVAAHA